MILTCPECATRYQTDAAKFPPAGRNVRCAKCSHVWHQSPPQPEPENDVVDVAPEAAPVYERSEAPVIDRTPVHEAPEAEAERIVPEPAYADPPQAAPATGRRIGLAVGWAVFIGIILAIGFAGVSYRQQIATVMPQSASLYSSMGMPVNTTGIDFRNYSQHMEQQDGQPVLIVSGDLVNISGVAVQVPGKIRVGVSDGQKREIYSWTFSPGVTSLSPGQSAPFKTRLSNPPPAARNLEVRFAKAGE